MCFYGERNGLEIRGAFRGGGKRGKRFTRTLKVRKESEAAVVLMR